MSQETTELSQSTEDIQESPAEALAALKTRADRLGIQYHPSIGYEKLSEKVTAALTAATTEQPQQPKAVVMDQTETLNEKRARKKREAFKLTRIRITCMNPAKREWEGEIFTGGNDEVGSVTKYVPFNNDEGWHVPQILLNIIQDRQCQVFHSVRQPNGTSVRKSKIIKEFAVEILDQLTPEEIKDLALRQAATKSIE